MSYKKSKPRRDIYQDVTDKIISELEAGTVPWIRPWADLRPVSANGRPYRGINVLILGMAQAAGGFSSHQWFTIKMANAVGGRIRKGERGTAVVLFRKITPKERDEDGEERKPFWITRHYHVWNRDQLDSVENLPKAGAVTRDLSDWESLSDQVAEGSGAEIRIGGNDAFYQPSTDHIQMPSAEQFVSLAEFHGTRYHELIHWTGADGRLNRKYGRFGNPDYAKEELVAEIGAAFLCAWSGIQAELQHPEYISSWLQVLKGDNQAVVRAASQAQQAADWLLDKAGLLEESVPLEEAA